MRWGTPVRRFCRGRSARFEVWQRVARGLAFLRGRSAKSVADSEQAIGESHDALLQDLQGLILRFHAITSQTSLQQPAAAMLDAALESSERLLIASRTRLQNLKDHAHATGLLRVLEEVALSDRLSGGSAAIVTISAGCRRRNVEPRVIENVAQFFLRVLHHAAHLEPEQRLRVLIECRRHWLRITFEQQAGRPVMAHAPGRGGNLLVLGQQLDDIACASEGRSTLSPRKDGSVFIALRIPGRIAYDRTKRGRASRLRSMVRPET